MGRTRVGAALEAHLHHPMHRSAYALIIGTGVTSVLGLLFWMLAARWLPASSVGIGAALVAALHFLATLSTLGLRTGLIRFLPVAGSATRRLVATCYALCAATAMLAALVFLAGQPWWASKLDLLREQWWISACFVVAVAFQVIFVLQDNVLIGLRRAVWVPISNSITSVAKIVLLPLLVFSAGWAIIAASVVPAVVAVVVVTILILRHAGRLTGAAGVEPVQVPQLVRFAATEHVAALLWIGTTELLTLVVLHKAGAEASAYYYMSFTIGYALYLITSNVGSALVAEAAHHPDRAPVLIRAAISSSARLVLPLAIVGGLLAPLPLALLGDDYARNGTVLLQLMLASAIPQTIVGTSLSVARIRRDYPMMFGINAALAVGIFGPTGRW